MASSDYNVADRTPETGAFPVEAGDKVNVTVQATPDAEAKAAADSANVSNPAFIGYAAALAAYESRADIETLADRRAREGASDDADQDFMRRKAYDSDGTAAAAPRPGTVHGDADKSA